MNAFVLSSMRVKRKPEKRSFDGQEGEAEGKTESSPGTGNNQPTRKKRKTNKYDDSSLKMAEDDDASNASREKDVESESSEARPSSSARKTRTKKNRKNVEGNDSEQIDKSKTESRINKPNSSDVLLGRGKPYQVHEGNLRMLEIINVHQQRYMGAKRHKRRSIANEVLEEILEGGGIRFLKRSKDKTQWEEVQRPVALEKVAHALRCKTRKPPPGSSAGEYEEISPASDSNNLSSSVQDGAESSGESTIDREGPFHNSSSSAEERSSSMPPRVTPALSTTFPPAIAGGFNASVFAGTRNPINSGNAAQLNPAMNQIHASVAAQLNPAMNQIHAGVVAQLNPFQLSSGGFHTEMARLHQTRSMIADSAFLSGSNRGIELSGVQGGGGSITHDALARLLQYPPSTSLYASMLSQDASMPGGGGLPTAATNVGAQQYTSLYNDHLLQHQIDEMLRSREHLTRHFPNATLPPANAHAHPNPLAGAPSPGGLQQGGANSNSVSLQQYYNDPVALQQIAEMLLRRDRSRERDE